MSENGAAWFARWTENGEPQRRRGSLESLKEAGLFDNPEASIFSSQRRVETFVTLGAPSETVFGSTGEGLELKPVTHPNDVFAGEEVTFGFLLDGEPAEAATESSSVTLIATGMQLALKRSQQTLMARLRSRRRSQDATGSQQVSKVRANLKDAPSVLVVLTL